LATKVEEAVMAGVPGLADDGCRAYEPEVRSE
jgi:hypothetical protein